MPLVALGVMAYKVAMRLNMYLRKYLSEWVRMPQWEGRAALALSRFAQALIAPSWLLSRHDVRRCEALA